jgi:hypothetical protein
MVNLVFFVVIGYISLIFGTFYHEKSGNPGKLCVVSNIRMFFSNPKIFITYSGFLKTGSNLPSWDGSGFHKDNSAYLGTLNT